MSQYFFCLFRITLACLDKKYITHHCANIDDYRLAPNLKKIVVIVGLVSQLIDGYWLASKGIHLPIAVMAVQQDFYKVLSEGPDYLLQRFESLL